MAHQLGGNVEPSDEREYWPRRSKRRQNRILGQLLAFRPAKAHVLIGHCDRLTSLAVPLSGPSGKSCKTRRSPHRRSGGALYGHHCIRRWAKPPPALEILKSVFVRRRRPFTPLDCGPRFVDESEREIKEAGPKNGGARDLRPSRVGSIRPSRGRSLPQALGENAG